MSVEQHQKVF